MDTSKDDTESNCYYESSDATNNFIREFDDLDEFFTATTAVKQDVKTRSCKENDQSPLVNTNIDITGTFDSADTEENYPSCLHDSRELDNEFQIQEVPQMPDAEAYEENQGDGQMDDGNANGIAHATDYMQQEISGRDKSRRSASNPARDNKYWDRRVKNNIAAKRSRDAKRLKETSVVERWNFLENENERLKKQIAEMKERTNELEKKLDLSERATAH